jgi:peptidoglycan DL-endopeptidase CwlO
MRVIALRKRLERWLRHPVRSNPLLTRIPSASRARTALLALLGGVLGLAIAVSAAANPSIRDKQAQAEAIIAEIERIDEDVGAAAERYNGAKLEMDRLSAELTEAREDLARARVLNTTAQRRVAVRLRSLYMAGESGGAVEIILGADNLNDMLDRIDIAQRVAAQDAEILRDVKAFRERVTTREHQIAKAGERQVVVVDHLATEKRAIEGQLAERQRLLASVKDEVARMQEAERRRQAELRRQAQLELERQQGIAEQQRLAAAERRQVERARAQQAAEQQPQALAVETPNAAPDEPADNGGDGLSGAAPGVVYAPPPPDASRGAQVVSIAMQYLGIPYVWATADPSVGFDCSGLTTYVFAKIGVSLPHYAAAQYTMGSPVSRDQLQPGDLVFFRGLGHMGMYIGGGNFIHAPRTGDVVKISPLSDPYYVRNWVGARRVL